MEAQNKSQRQKAGKAHADVGYRESRERAVPFPYVWETIGIWYYNRDPAAFGNGSLYLVHFGRRIDMIEVTKLNDIKILINPDLIEYVEETPDTVVALTTGRKIIVKESRQEVKNLVKSYRKEIFAD